MVNFRGLTAKAKQLAQRNPEKVDKVLGGAGDFVDKRTGGKYGRHVHTAQQKARRFLAGDRPAAGGSADGRTSGKGPDGRQAGPGRPGDTPGAGGSDQERPA